jgi:hypothetical protein
LSAEIPGTFKIKFKAVDFYILQFKLQNVSLCGSNGRGHYVRVPEAIVPRGRMQKARAHGKKRDRPTRTHQACKSI